MSNSSSQLKRGYPLHDGGINGVDEERPQALKNFVKAKQKINAIFANFMCLEYFINILNGLSDKNDIKKDLSEVRLSNVAVCKSAVFSLYFTPGLQSSVCFLPLVCSLQSVLYPLVSSLQSVFYPWSTVFSLYFTPGLQSSVCFLPLVYSLQSVFYPLVSSLQSVFYPLVSSLQSVFYPWSAVCILHW